MTEQEYLTAANLRAAELKKAQAALVAEQRKIQEETAPRLAPLKAALDAIESAPVAPALVIVENSDNNGRRFHCYRPGERTGWVAWFRCVTGGLERGEKAGARWTLTLTHSPTQRLGDVIFTSGDYAAIKGDYEVLRDRAIQAIRDAGYEILEVRDLVLVGADMEIPGEILGGGQ